MKSIKPVRLILSLAVIGLLSSFIIIDKPVKKQSAKPAIVNIVNFIRLLEPRDSAITQDVLYQTVVKQVAIMKKYKLGGSFLLQYDALMDPRYQKLLKALPRNSFEIGAWWEIPQPLVEKAGLKWRGRYPWDWRANIGFSTGYTLAEREKITDVYMADFKRIFGYYPKSVASWFIDAHTLQYMYNKYHIVASANCKDQYGTDGYTLWGGYWNQAYYPSKINSYMPAQHAANQIPVPIFRMLGSDPIRQYDTGLGTSRQGVVTLEPVYAFGGGDAEWVKWFLREFVQGESMEFAYTQAGQENSFTWDAMAKGFEIQMPLIAKLRDQHKVKVETLAASGEWFKAHYKTTPATSVTVNKDMAGSDRKTVWFNSRFYRSNLLWEKGTLKFRDIHLFDEKFPSIYEKEKATANECVFFTLPVVDGYIWSTPKELAGLKFKAVIDNKVVDLEGGDPVISNPSPGKLFISWPLKGGHGNLTITMGERIIKINVTGGKANNWYLDMTAPDKSKLPYTTIAQNKLNASFEGMNYAVKALSGYFKGADDSSAFKLYPDNNTIILNLAGSN
ncbi:hypothetical protein FFF34_017305 [Inquilinus sp. KBS0705]|nr:hypothetical protein FFF34_017305 [Inquilinus sp. KBS0705]